jgi:hypothetical protein
MSELTLESLARRLEEVERRLNEKQPSVIAPTKDWRSVVEDLRSAFKPMSLRAASSLSDALTGCGPGMWP